MPETINESNVTEQFTKDSVRYSRYVNCKRALPDYKDGLKPVQRRILFCAFNDIKAINGKKVKSASIVGRVMDLYHPHGDAAIYGTMKPMINNFETKMSLLSKTGNFGNFHGDPAAASRYTESGVSQFAMDAVLDDLLISPYAVDWNDNYSQSALEPEYLPAKVPLLLINGCFGIGMGAKKVEIPKHNFNEVIDVTLLLLRNPTARFELIPDHCMPCEIFKTNFEEIGEKGFGMYKVRGVIDIEDYEGKTALVIKSIPDLTYLDFITSKIEKLVVENKIIGISEVFDKSSISKKDDKQDEMRYIIVLKKGADPYYIRDVIYKNTGMEQNCRINFEVLDGINVVRFSYRDYLLNFIKFRKLTKFRVYCNELQKLQTKYHERDAYIKVLQSGEIDKIINMIRKQNEIDDDYLVEYLISKLNITNLQALYIIGANIKKLSLGYLNKYKAEAAELEMRISEILKKIVDDNILTDEIERELIELKQKYNSPRICKVISDAEDSDIPQGEFKIITTENNFIKKVPINSPIGTFKNDSPKLVLKAENRENILIFDEMGRVFKLPVSKIPLSDKNSNGTDIRMIVKGLTANINTIMYEPIVQYFNDLPSYHYLISITEMGYIKAMSIKDFLTVPPSGIIYSKMTEGDSVKSIVIAPRSADVIIYSQKQANRMKVTDIPLQKRNTRGSHCIESNEPVDGISLISGPSSTDVVVITESGKVNRFPTVSMPYAKNKKGTNVIKLSKNDKIKYISVLNENNVIRVILRSGNVELKVSDIPVSSSISAGNRLIPIKGDTIIRCDIIK